MVKVHVVVLPAANVTSVIGLKAGGEICAMAPLYVPAATDRLVVPPPARDERPTTGWPSEHVVENNTGRPGDRQKPAANDPDGSPTCTMTNACEGTASATPVLAGT